jgi:hypothetical protein
VGAECLDSGEADCHGAGGPVAEAELASNSNTAFSCEFSLGRSAVAGPKSGSHLELYDGENASQYREVFHPWMPKGR